MTTDNKQRLFFALWPGAAVRERMAALARDLPRREGRRVPAENLHATLVFLGPTDAAARARAEAAVDGVRGRAFRLRLDECGYWPRPRVAWLSPSVVPLALTEFHAALSDALGGGGVAIDPRPFVPHVTVLRDARRQPLPGPVGPIDWEVDSFVLVESVTHAGGARYAVLRTWPLSRGAG